MKLDPWKRLQIRFMWAVLHLLTHIARKWTNESVDVRPIELELRKLKDQELL